VKIILVGWLALLFASFEIVQLILAQRYIGIEQIRRNQHPVDLAVPPSLKLSLPWLYLLMLSYLFQVSLLFLPMAEIAPYTVYPYRIRMAAFLMIFVGLIGFSLRRVCGIRWGLVVMTFEGAMRAGFMLFVFYSMVLHWNFNWVFNLLYNLRHKI